MPPDGSGARLRSGLDELEHELVLWLGRIRRVAVARIAGISQEVAFPLEPEPGGLDFLAQERLLDTVQRAGLRDARSRPARVVSDGRALTVDDAAGSDG